MLYDVHGRPMTAGSSRRTNAVQVPVRVRGRYDAAQHGGTYANHWANADHFSPDTAANPAVRSTMRSRCRYEVANNSYAAGIISTLANYVVGVGPKLRLIPPIGASPRAELNLQRLSRLFNLWAWDVGLGRKLQTLRRTKAVDGEGFGMLVTRKVPEGKISLGIVTFEADMVTDPNGTRYDTDKPEGIELGADGEPKSYTILKKHPGSGAASYNAEAITVPASQVLHWYNEDRPGLHRGIPEIAPVLQQFAQLRRYTSAVVVAAETAADFAAVMQTNQPQGADDEEGVVVEEGATMELNKGQVTALPEGYNLSQVKAEHPGPQHEQFIRCIVRELGRCIDMPYAVAAMDASGHNYSSMRGDWQAFFQSILMQRYGCEQQALDKVLLAWMLEAKYVYPMQLPEEYDYTWDWPAAEPTDPVKQAQADEIALKNRTTTYARVYARQGLNSEDELPQVAREQEILRNSGIAVQQAAAPAAKPDPADDGDGDGNPGDGKAA